MANWQDEMVPILRYLIDDVSSTPTYTSTRLEETLAVAAQLTLFEMENGFDKEYVVDVTQVSISPDPTADTRDNAFISLIVLKAVCLVFGAEAKTAASESVRITDGPSTIDATSGSQMKYKRYEEACDRFTRARRQYLAGNAKFVAAVLGPYTNESVSIIPWNF